MYRKLFKNCSTISAGLMVSRLSGMMKIAVVAAIFGTDDSMDAFLVAMAIPAALLTVFGEGVYVATVKLVSRHKGEGGDPSEDWREVSSLFNFSVAGMTAFAASYWLCAPLIVRLVAPGFDEGKFVQAATLARCVAPVIVLVTIQHVLNAILHANDHFALPAVKVLLSNIFVVASIAVLHRHLGIVSYALGSVAGELFVCTGSLIMAKRLGARYSFSWAAYSRGVRESVRLGVPVIACVGVLQITNITDRAFASGLPPGSIAALGYAMLLLTVPLSLVRTVVDVGFPSITAIVHRPGKERQRQLAGAIRACVKVLVVAAVPAAVLLLLWRKPVISILLERGKFGSASASTTAVALMFYSFALVPIVSRYFLTRLSQSFGDSLTPLPSNIACTVSNIAFNILLVPILGHAAIALSLALSGTIGAGVLYVQLRRKITALRNCGIEILALKVLGAGALMVGGYVAAERISDSFVGAGCAGAGVYAVALLLARVVDIRRLLQWRILPTAPSA